jgi:glutamate-5-semialdehyde dehydrogenase
VGFRDYDFGVNTQQQVIETAERAREASHALALATRAQKDAALLAMAEALLARSEEILAG